jgi:Ca2+-dependent lipid-binding protein
LQVDLQKLDEVFAKLVLMTESIVQIVLGYGMCSYIIGYPILTVIVVFVVFAVGTVLLYKAIFKIEGQILKL